MKAAPILLLALLPIAPALRAETTSSVIPVNFPAERYEALIARSPFTLATPPAAPPPAPDKSFADGWYVTSLARVDGMDFVSIKSRDGGVQFTLFGPEPKEGVTLQKVDWSTSVGRSTVTITKDGQVAKLEFNQAEIAAAPQAPAAPAMANRPGAAPGVARPAVPRPGAPVIQPQGINVAPKAPVPGLPNQTVPRPANVPTPGGFPGTNVLPNTGTIPPTSVGNDGRRRIRVIQNNPTQ